MNRVVYFNSTLVKSYLKGFHIKNTANHHVARKSIMNGCGIQRSTAVINNFSKFNPLWKRMIVETRTTQEEDLMPKSEFHQKADDVLEHLAEKIEHALEDHVEDLDIQYSDGILTANLGKHGTYVLNKQTPNRQIWFSSPVSGPKRYNYNNKDNTWINTRDGHELRSFLGEEMTKLTGQSLHFV